MNAFTRIASIGSSIVSSSSDSGRPREIHETLLTKLFNLKWTFLAIILNVLLLSTFNAMVSPKGFTTNVLVELFSADSPVIVELFMNLNHFVTSMALTEGLANYLGYLISRPEGYSLAVCGFAHASTIDKLTFASRLSYRSPSKKLITRLIVIIFLHHAALFLTIFSSTTVYPDDLREDSGIKSCLEYTQDGKLHDRGFPTIEIEYGVAEYVFGTSLGFLTSEMDVAYTTHIMPPQLIDTLDDGTSIVGNGFTTDIRSTCVCAKSKSSAHLVEAGFPSAKVATVISLTNTLSTAQGMVNTISYDENSKNTTVISLLNSYNICGGTNGSYPPAVCQTVLSNHRTAEIVSTYMTDGTPASIALKIVDLRSVGDKVDQTWVYQALNNLIGNGVGVGFFELPSTYPGATNPLLWWATTNMQTVSRTYLSSGIETTFAILMRAAIQRSYSFTATLCPQNVKSLLAVIIRMSSGGYFVGCVFAYAELVICGLSIIATLPWLLSRVPLSPAVKLAKDSVYFRFMISGAIDNGHIRLSQMMETKDYWPRLDVVMRMGESIKTRDDPDTGLLALDKPRMIVGLSDTKMYK
ncbi:hypothetical protein EDD86DRAFT_190954 [Gorgonomyces haynaldii]|nr:hypothetical protein EDD86DRAFT_190954 [Gorgonomyces haynaldii]